MRYDASAVYHSSHEWARKEGELLVIGISDYAQDSLGDIVFVELPAPGKYLKKDQPFGVVESVKAASDVYAPVSGFVEQVNDSLVDNPGLVNSDPFGEGWFIKIKPDNTAEYEALMTAQAYEAFVKGL
ncbi:MAG: glycine cleavage system protein GcvH [Spirochaetales bacterium]|jgi:glycine cleavage system H protein|nr:glycine cleavage system protein GcvH [Spirochaetales bacterium]